MSYRDIRNFTEMLRALGYPSLVSMESFRKPNFPLVAELLVWLAKRFDPDADISTEFSTEDQRVALIRNAAQFMAMKANIKFNTKRLYQADGYAVKELLKVASLLYDALKVNDSEQQNDDDIDDVNLKDFDITDKLHDLKQSRQLATEITTAGASLFDLLGKEAADLRNARNSSAGKQYEVAEVESDIKTAIEAIKGEISDTKQLIDNVSATEQSLDSKIERRKVEIDRYEKRLQTLKKVRPAFLEEFNALEVELERLFVQYSVQLRCLNQLEKAAAEAERAHVERQQLVANRRIVTTVPLETGDPEELEKLSLDDIQPEKKDEALASRQERPRARTGGRMRSERPHTNIFGGIEPNASLSGSSLDLSSESDTDIFLDKDEPELQHSDDDSLGLELSNIERRAPSGRKTSQVQDNSDDDF